MKYSHRNAAWTLRRWIKKVFKQKFEIIIGVLIRIQSWLDYSPFTEFQTLNRTGIHINPAHCVFTHCGPIFIYSKNSPICIVYIAFCTLRCVFFLPQSTAMCGVYFLFSFNRSGPENSKLSSIVHSPLRGLEYYLEYPTVNLESASGSLSFAESILSNSERPSSSSPGSM